MQRQTALEAAAALAEQLDATPIYLPSKDRKARQRDEWGTLKNAKGASKDGRFFNL